MSHISRTVLAFIVTLLSAATCLAAPAVTVVPKAGPPTSSLTVSGRGYGATQLIDIYFDQTDLCLAASDNLGAFSCAIKVPKDAQPQNHWITAMQRFNGTAAQKAFTVRTDWAQFHGRNAAHNGYNPFENTLNVGNAANLDNLWTKPIGPGGTTSAPVVGGGNIYVGGIDHHLYAFDATTGATAAGFPKTLG